MTSKMTAVCLVCVTALAMTFYGFNVVANNPQAAAIFFNLALLIALITIAVAILSLGEKK